MDSFPRTSARRADRCRQHILRAAASRARPPGSERKCSAPALPPGDQSLLSAMHASRTPVGRRRVWHPGARWSSALGAQAIAAAIPDPAAPGNAAAAVRESSFIRALRSPVWIIVCSGLSIAVVLRQRTRNWRRWTELREVGPRHERALCYCCETEPRNSGGYQGALPHNKLKMLPFGAAAITFVPGRAHLGGSHRSVAPAGLLRRYATCRSRCGVASDVSACRPVTNALRDAKLAAWPKVLALKTGGDLECLASSFGALPRSATTRGQGCAGQALRHQAAFPYSSAQTSRARRASGQASLRN